MSDWFHIYYLCMMVAGSVAFLAQIGKPREYTFGGFVLTVALAIFHTIMIWQLATS